MLDLEQLQRQVRASLAIERFDPSAADGCRMAVIVAVPLVAAALSGRLDIALLMSLGAFNVGLADPGGPYDVRFRATVTASLAMAVAVIIATLVAGLSVVAIVALALWVFVMTLASDLGPTAPGVSFVAVAIFVIALGLPTDAAAAGFRVAWFLVGCGWAVVVTSAAWPLRPDAPGRAQLAHTFTMIADFLRATPHDDASRSASRDQIASASKSARAAVVHGTRHGGGRGRRLLLALEASADLERSLGALDRALDAAQPAPRELTDAVAALADTCDDTAAGLSDDDLPSSARLDGAMAALADAPLDGDASVARDVLRLIVQNLPLPSSAPTVATRPGPRLYRDRLRGVLDVHSLLFRHAIRLAVVVAAAQALAFVDPYEKSYWIPLAAVVILRPDLGSTITRGMQRLAGTIVGVTIAFAIVTLGDDREWALIAGFVLVSGLMGAVFDLNYALAVAALTPAVILLVSIDGGGPGLEIARLGGTLVGGGLALAGGLLLWPVWERSALGPALADGATGGARYLEQIVDPSYAVDQVRATHRDAERSRSAAEGMLRQMLSEPPRHWIAASEVTDYCTRLQTLVESTTELRAATWRVRPEAAQDDVGATALRERIARSVASLDEACDALSGTAARHLDGPVGPIADPPVDPTPDRPADPVDTSAGSRCHPDRALDLLVARIEHATSGLCRAADQVAAALATSRRADDAEPSI